MHRTEFVTEVTRGFEDFRSNETIYCNCHDLASNSVCLGDYLS
jgi:hypothetical protein